MLCQIRSTLVGHETASAEIGPCGRQRVTWDSMYDVTLSLWSGEFRACGGAIGLSSDVGWRRFRIPLMHWSRQESAHEREERGASLLRTRTLWRRAPSREVSFITKLFEFYRMHSDGSYMFREGKGVARRAACGGAVSRKEHRPCRT